MSKPTIDENCDDIRAVIWQETDSNDNPIPEQAILIKQYDGYITMQQADRNVIVNLSTLKPLAKLLVAMAKEMT